MLLKSDMEKVVSSVKSIQKEEFELNIRGLCEAYMRANENLTNFSDTFQRCNLIYIFCFVFYLVLIPVNGIFDGVVSFMAFSLLTVMLYVLALPSIPAEKLLDTMDKMRPRQSELADFLLLKNEIRQCAGAVKLYEYRITQPKIISILLKFLFVLVLLKSKLSTNFSGIISLVS